MKSGFLKLNVSDFLKGLLMAVLTAFLTGCYQLVQDGSDLNWITFKPVVLAAVGAGLAYLIKQFVTNSDGKLLKAERSSSGGGSGMKFGILVLLLSGLGLCAQAQYLVPRGQIEKKVDPWAGFFRPVDKSLLNASYGVKTGENQSVWLFRPTVEVSALQLLPSKAEGKVFDVSSFQSVGMGISYQHFILYNGEPLNNYGFNFLMLFDAIPRETTALNISVAGTVSVLQFMNFGAGYNIGMNKVFLLTGLTYNFN